MLNFQNFVPKVYMTTPIDVVVFKCRKICSTGNWLNSCVICMTKKTKFRLPLKLLLLLGSRPKSARASPQHLAHKSQCSTFHPNRFNFG